MNILQTSIPVTSQTIFVSLVNEKQIPGHSVVSMFVRHTAVHVFVCGREQHIHYTAAVRRKALQQESVLSHQLVASNTHTHTHTYTHIHTHTHINCALLLDAGSRLSTAPWRTKRTTTLIPEKCERWVKHQDNRVWLSVNAFSHSLNWKKVQRQHISCLTWRGSASHKRGWGEVY